ncbi:hypothetical protein EYC80_000990 [Monilinia laxa]|uniref:Zinc-binding loop region of homing endonuclease domain-containing protein n=1 Tax=Monilinia laxa TaxID=61186 RepID=A0A5N6K7X6_MONLA|nr:hypothetical protein EYC80_000990 [Monilinia laxa]
MSFLQSLSAVQDNEHSVAPPIDTLGASSQPPFFRYNLSEETFDGSMEQEQTSEEFLSNNHGLSGGTYTPSRDSDDRIVIDLAQDSQNSSAGLSEEHPNENALFVALCAQISRRPPLTDITHDLVSTTSAKLPIYEESRVPSSSIYLTKSLVLEFPCEVESTGARSKDLATAMCIKNPKNASTSGAADLDPNTSNSSKANARKSSIHSDIIQSRFPLGDFSVQSSVFEYTSTTDDSILIPATHQLANASNKPSPSNTLPCKERKRIILSSTRRPVHIKKAMQLWLESTNRLFDPFREDNECWFHPAPPPPRMSSIGTLRPYGNIKKSFYWQDRNGRHSIALNFGIVSKILFHAMSKLQRDGFINKKWHLSHLCGNWTCLNPSHTTVEPGNVNISRNNCFSHRGGCLHDPNCMKEKKVNLGANGIPIYPDSDIVLHADADKGNEEWLTSKL